MTPGVQIRLATLGNVSEMVHRKVFQTSFRPVSDLFLDLSLGYLSIIVVVVVAVVVRIKILLVFTSSIMKSSSISAENGPGWL